MGQACDPSQVSTPSFDSQLHQVTIVGGADNDAGTIEVLAVPFVLQPVPAPGTSTTNPVAVSFTVADASTGIDRSSIAASVRQGGGPAQNIGLTLTPCNDSGSTPCSQDVQLGVTGFHVTGVAPTLGSGTAEMHIRADNLASPPALLDFLYAFTVVVPTPTAVPTPTEPRATPTASTPITLVLPAGADIGEAAKRLPPGSTLIVSPGVYAPVDIGPDELRGPITLLGDAGGALTNSSGTAVVVNGRGRAAAIRLSSQADVVIDGFTVRGGSEAGLLLINSPGVTVRNCVMKVNRGDGVQLQQSDGVVVFNNLIWDNDGAGISVRDSNAVRLINNTVYRNTRAGIVVGDQGEGASDTDARDNIIDQNTAPGLVVNPSATGFFGDFNLNNDGYQGTDPGFHDIVGLSPLFIYPTGEDFHLQAFTGGTISPAVDAGDFDLEAEFVDALQQRVSRSDGLLDVPPVELGYHYLPPVATPTPRPRPTSTPTPSPARTTSPTRTPTR